MRTFLAWSSPVAVGAGLFGIIVLGPSLAQQPAPPDKGSGEGRAEARPGSTKQDDKPLVFTTGARLVVADVTVKDKQGQHH